MRMKVAVTLLLLVGCTLLLCWPWFVGIRPHHPSHREAEWYLLKFSLYIMTLLVIFFSVAAMSFILVRKAREEYREMSLNNMRELIEAARQDHLGKKDEHSA
jgi:heme/copper-type cytochrome/quinol oxidase subunit 2